MTHARFFSLFMAALQLAGGLSLSAAEPAAQNPAEDSRSREQAWIEDIDYLMSELERRHPNPYHSVPERVFDERVSQLEARLGAMTDPEVVVERRGYDDRERFERGCSRGLIAEDSRGTGPPGDSVARIRPPDLIHEA